MFHRMPSYLTTTQLKENKDPGSRKKEHGITIKRINYFPILKNNGTGKRDKWRIYDNQSIATSEDKLTNNLG